MKTVIISGIGEISLVKSKKARKYYNIRINKEGYVILSIPRGGTYKRAEIIARDNYLKIQKAKSKHQQRQKKQRIFSENDVYHTSNSKIRVIKEEKKENNFFDEKDTIKIIIPDDKDISSDEVQEYIKECIRYVLRKEANNYIPARVYELAKKHDLKYNNVKISKAEKRWGSCSSVNNLNFSFYLITLPGELIDYIILHELSHTVHKNHSSEFYSLLDKLTEGNHESLEKRLKNYNIGIY